MHIYTVYIHGCMNVYTRSYLKCFITFINVSLRKLYINFWRRSFLSPKIKFPTVHVLCACVIVCRWGDIHISGLIIETFKFHKYLISKFWDSDKIVTSKRKNFEARNLSVSYIQSFKQLYWLLRLNQNWHLLNQTKKW